MSKIQGHQNLERDDNNMAIINTDSSKLRTAKRLKERIKTQDSEINTLRQEVNEMKDILLQINERMKWQEQ
tara:strand:- start:533 stop:745 length:213 start_codon:yes stop_codon:yes gene_type:complete